MSTRKKNAQTHPGRIILDAQRKRRTRNDIEEDEACSQAKAIALEDNAAAKNCAVMERITELEETAKQEDRMVQRFCIRPDQAQGIMQERHTIPVLRPTSEEGTADNMEEDEDKEEGDTQSGGSIPPESTIANGSSQSQLRSNGINNEGISDASDGSGRR